MKKRTLLKSGVIEIHTNVALLVIMENFGTVPLSLHKRQVLGIAIPQDPTAMVLNTEEPAQKKEQLNLVKFVVNSVEDIDISTLLE